MDMNFETEIIVCTWKGSDIISEGPSVLKWELGFECRKKGIKSIPASERLHLWLAAAYALNGDMKEADWEAVQVFSLNPNSLHTHL